MDKRRDQGAQRGPDPHHLHHPRPHRDGHVKTQEHDTPDRAEGGKRHGKHDESSRNDRLEIEIVHEKNNQQGRGDKKTQPLPYPLHILVLSTPGNGISGGKRDVLTHRFLGIADIPPDVPAPHIHVHVAA